MSDIVVSFFKALSGFFWCDAGTDAVLCAGLMQARVLAVIGGLAIIALWRIGSAVKRGNRFKETRFDERRNAYVRVLQHHLRVMALQADNGSEPLILDGPLSAEDWKHHSFLPPKLQTELDKLVSLAARYNTSLQQPAPVAPKTELSARGPAEAPRSGAELKKQIAKCQKMAAAIR